VATDEARQARDDKLDRLQQALDEWHTAEKKRLEDEATFLRSLLRGRTGSARLSQGNTAQAEVLVTADITSFLAG
jgi:hypothetical protein